MITKFKLFEYHAYGKTKEKFFEGDVYITFDDNEGKLNYYNNNPSFNMEDKQKILNMLKKYYDIEEHTEKYMMTERAWGWILWFSNSFNQTIIQVSIITTPGWHIDKNYNQITSKELIKIGLENLETYFNAKKYNL